MGFAVVMGAIIALAFGVILFTAVYGALEALYGALASLVGRSRDSLPAEVTPKLPSGPDQPRARPALGSTPTPGDLPVFSAEDTWERIQGTRSSPIARRLRRGTPGS